jgi:ApaG protein
MYSKTTKKINITVKPYYLEDQSEPEDQHYVWAYKVTIDNQGNEKVHRDPRLRQEEGRLGPRVD